ncbi:MAG TPA: YciI family protein [Cyclobacteriaceae bacterium]|nr:YciI family protein [Cyclobacteriaceae bacterium]
MEKFMFIFHGGSSGSSLSPAEAQTNMQKWFAWVEKLQKENRYLSGEPLEPRGKLVSGSKKLVTDGPFAEGKELVGGYFVIHAKDLDEAVVISKDCPDFEYNGKVEVRPVMKM